MAEEEFPDFAAIAQEAAKDLLAGLNVEDQIVAEEHDLKLKLLMWDNIIEHLNSLVAEDTDLHKLLLKAIDKLTEIRDLVESYEVEDLRLIAEEKAIARKLSVDMAHRNWKLVRIVEGAAKKKAKTFEKLEIQELNKLAKKFGELHALLENSNVLKVKLKDGRTSPEEFKREEEYYFLQIWRFAATYLNILSGLVKKEEEIVRKVK